ncbi:OmpP1/FadL family transporter [Cyclobacterium plantarum]|uniref:Long-chain fatty acid transporter n=1 Tax=Cyclobacterium plantarum TaxID=2716263 RepID=A0ABX0HB46_9BACT|nr:long-chain fatty acid transporter [Cyclobacterium plantarum]NHE57647.1 long-chain fatty acid transporter [Cyclobacterium plantarum]
MKGLKLILSLAVLSIIHVQHSTAQSGYVEDALRFSQFGSTGSARISALGGTQNALGGDISNVHGNPAGLGFFQQSEFSLTAAYSDWNAETFLLNQSRGYNATNFSIPNLGAVISRAKAPLEVGDWRGGSFGISINRQASYNNNFGYFSNQLDQGSILDYYVDLYNEQGVPNGTDGLYFEAFLINPEDGGYNYVPNATLALEKSEMIENEGSMSQIGFSYGGNYKNKLFIGASLGINSVNFRSTKTYNEEFLDDNDASTLFSSLQENLFLEGSGINLGLGIIYKPVDRLNLGLNFKSPTWNRFNEEYDADIFANFTPPYEDPEFGTISESDAETDIFLSSYNLRTPMKVGAGFTYFFGKNGFISADADFLDYSTANLRSNVFNTGEDNVAISDIYGQAINYSVGGEYRVKMIRIRAGYAFYGDPFAEPGNLDRSNTQLSGGIGVKLPGFSVDFGLVNSMFNSYYNSYPGSNLATTENNILSGMLTLGFSF